MEEAAAVAWAAMRGNAGLLNSTANVASNRLPLAGPGPRELETTHSRFANGNLASCRLSDRTSGQSAVSPDKEREERDGCANKESRDERVLAVTVIIAQQHCLGASARNWPLNRDKKMRGSVGDVPHWPAQGLRNSRLPRCLQELRAENHSHHRPRWSGRRSPGYVRTRTAWSQVERGYAGETKGEMVL